MRSEAEIAEYNKDKESPKIQDIALVEDKEGITTLTVKYSAGKQLSKSGKNIKEVYIGEKVKGHSINLNIYRPE